MLSGGNGGIQVHRSLTALAVLALLLGSTIAAPQASAGGGGDTTLQTLSLVGTGGFVASAPGSGDSATDELAPNATVNRLIPHTGTSAARVLSLIHI